MTQGSLLPSLIRFAIPLILSGVLQLAFNTADLIVVGRFAGENSLAAVGANTSVITLMVNIMLGLCVGTSVMTARHFGARNDEALRDTVNTSVFIGFFGGVLFGGAGIIVAEPLLTLMGTPEEVLTNEDLEKAYGVPASMLKSGEEYTQSFVPQGDMYLYLKDQNVGDVLTGSDSESEQELGGDE